MRAIPIVEEELEDKGPFYEDWRFQNTEEEGLGEEGPEDDDGQGEKGPKVEEGQGEQ